jgi:hypothetical protein
MISAFQHKRCAGRADQSSSCCRARQRAQLQADYHVITTVNYIDHEQRVKLYGQILQSRDIGRGEIRSRTARSNRSPRAIQATSSSTLSNRRHQAGVASMMSRPSPIFMV